jgi:hypothetical protein
MDFLGFSNDEITRIMRKMKRIIMLRHAQSW